MDHRLIGVVGLTGGDRGEKSLERTVDRIEIRAGGNRHRVTAGLMNRGQAHQP